MTPDTVITLISTAVGLGNILQGLFALKRAGVDPTPEQWSKMEEKGHEAGQIASGNVASEIIASGLSEEMVEVISREMRRIKEDLRRVYSDPGMTIAEQQRASDFSRRDYCAAIHNMKKHLGGKLPEELEKEWGLNLCSQFYFR